MRKDEDLMRREQLIKKAKHKIQILDTKNQATKVEKRKEVYETKHGLLT